MEIIHVKIYLMLLKQWQKENYNIEKEIINKHLII